MEHLQNKVKILIAVEGNSTERNFFNGILSLFGIKADLFVVSTNLYALYDRMTAYEMQCDVKNVLKELVSSDEEKEILNQNFTYTYLVFDSDLHHKSPRLRNTDVIIDELVEENFSKLSEMSKYFVDESDPSVGRLYINYPMMESYRYCNSFDDEDYIFAKVKIDEISKFKAISSSMKLSGYDINRYTKDNYLSLIKMNIKRLVNIFSDFSGEYPSYNDYLKISDGSMIAEKQGNQILETRLLSIINTSIFIVMDYYGNRDSFYDNLFKFETVVAEKKLLEIG